MYGSDSKLSQRPFVSVPRIDRYFPGATIEEARARLVRCIERAEGPALLIGPAGVGKSLLCQVLADHFQSELAIVSLASARLCSRRALLQMILFELGLPYRDMEEGELRLSLIDRLASPTDAHGGMLLLVDEAHHMPFALLEEMRMITNLVREGQPRVQLVLAGLPALEERFANPKLECFNQRLAARCYLGALTRLETAQYVRAQIAASQIDPDALLTAAALEAVYHATDGVPRLINQLCDQALLSADEAGTEMLDGATIEAAWSELQQLPTPWCGTSPDAPPADEAVIEFGCLDDLPSDSDLEETALPTADASDPPATTEPDIAADIEERLEEIDQGLVELHARDDDSAEFVPAGTIGPEQAAERAECDALERAIEPLEMLTNDVDGAATGADDKCPHTNQIAELAKDDEETDAGDALNYNPFEESYDDDEVIIDQYSALACDVFRQQPRVTANDDGMPLHLLRHASCYDEFPSLSLVEATVEETVKESVEVTAEETVEVTAGVVADAAQDDAPQELSADMCAPDAPDNLVPSPSLATPTAETEEFVVCGDGDLRPDASLTDLIITPAAAVVTVDTGMVSDALAALVPMTDAPIDSGETGDSTAEATTDATGDGDVIVIEDQDGKALDETLDEVSVAPVHAGQYAQLFARLRRA